MFLQTVLISLAIAGGDSFSKISLIYDRHAILIQCSLTQIIKTTLYIIDNLLIRYSSFPSLLQTSNPEKKFLPVKVKKNIV